MCDRSMKSVLFTQRETNKSRNFWREIKIEFFMWSFWLPKKPTPKVKFVFANKIYSQRTRVKFLFASKTLAPNWQWIFCLLTKTQPQTGKVNFLFVNKKWKKVEFWNTTNYHQEILYMLSFKFICINYFSISSTF